ncbi:hypothetical protein C2G38_460611 [Gigaspora rosea]|uniref:RING-type domain-containing protein n=1 Tax=Gigaspora rosea TaxID=44941 RepID=A0A397VUW6_9GLOM|nr:hypothetical protein C2G38_460611 [Gigaspora rosea]
MLKIYQFSGNGEPIQINGSRLTMPQGVFNSKISQVVVLEELEGSRMPVPFEDVSPEDTCIICLDSFVDPDTTTSDQHVVKLPPCHGHYFHRVCVASAIKLRDECPMCKKRVDY